jgi:hypothetical protein
MYLACTSNGLILKYICETWQLPVMIQTVFQYYRGEAEILTILLWKERTRKEDIYQVFKHFVAK